MLTLWFMDKEQTSRFYSQWRVVFVCIELFGRNTLQLPLKSIGLGYKQEKVRFVFELRDSPDLSVQNTNIQVRTGRKWNAMQTVDQAI